ncbi:MAG: exodeoxyribonuclease V subunit beta [Thermodesulfobacteriota bacterium]|nr:exodeoxyribonuclease V subunit beta [Thermodesulfobacteriota bacterium]
MQKFDIINTLLSGINLIEASAGTGKTYAIAGLFVRLIVECQLTADQILVVTFTKAATNELKERIRKKLIQAKDAFNKGVSEDGFINGLMRKTVHHHQAADRLHDALVDFDRAAIFTIHGFCQRILHENAFETGSLYDTELITEQDSLLLEVAEDFWRNKLYGQSPEFISYALKNKKITGPEDFLNLLGRMKTRDMKIIPGIKKTEIKSLDTYREMLNRLKKKWHDSRDEVITLLNDPSLNGKIYGSIKEDPNNPGYTKRQLKVISMEDDMDHFTASTNTGFPLFDKFENFTATKIIKCTKKNQSPVRHDFFDFCDKLKLICSKLETEFDNYLLFLKTQLFEYAKAEILKRKKKNNIQFYDDLLYNVRDALRHDAQDTKDGKSALAKAVRQKYRAALVDEFQDTDFIQYEIFTRLFSLKETRLFMIGDPKQAIYGFRGADIFSYMQAASHAEVKYTLFKNWRSKPGLIRAVNTIFSHVTSAFVFDKIVFNRTEPAEKAVVTPGMRNDKQNALLKLWYVKSNEAKGTEAEGRRQKGKAAGLGSDRAGRKKDITGGKPVNKSDAVLMIGHAVSGEIARITSAVENPVKAGDIAVLVRTNRQAGMIKDLLSQKNIPSVLYSTGNIFDSDEAMEMERLLWAIAEPGNERRLKSALVTRILGVSAQELDSAENTAQGLETWMSKFREYFKTWHQHGFIRMYRWLMSREGVKTRILSLDDGERRLTNLLHLSELLHQQDEKNNTGMTGLIKWLSSQTSPSAPRLEEHQLRLERDGLAVKIITIHKSKGLEFPVVFCPFCWESSEIKDREVVFHDLSGNQSLTLDIGSKQLDRHIALAQNELLAENVRLLYVALTRAKELCYLVWGRINRAETSAMAYLLHDLLADKDMAKTDDIITELKNRFDRLDDDQILTDLKRISHQSSGAIELSLIPHENDLTYASVGGKEEKYDCRKFKGKIDRKWKISSYSSLVSGQLPDDELPDHDAFTQWQQRQVGSLIEFNRFSPQFDPTDDTEKVDIFSFPKGTRAGIFFHDILENIDFEEESGQVRQNLVTAKLQEYGFDVKWEKTVCDMIGHLICTPLLEDRKDLVLSSVSTRHRINEMEFYFPLKTVTTHRLSQVFAKHGGINISPDFSSRIEKLTFMPSKGFMKGYIDLIFRQGGKFYLVDWKSNYLGNHIENYRRDSLDETMNRDLYVLQYHIYLLALHQYLQLHIPRYSYEADFGGIFYIFLRGMNSSRGSKFGVYHDLPRWDLIDALGKELIPDFIE